MTDSRDDIQTVQHYARSFFDDEEFQALMELQQRCVDKHAEMLGDRAIVEEFGRFFWRDRQAVREWAELKPELRARRVAQFEAALENQSRRAKREQKDRQRRASLQQKAVLPGDKSRSRQGERGNAQSTSGKDEDPQWTIERERPLSRSECPPYRPCPYVSCRYNLFLDVTRRGRLRLNFPKKDIIELESSCALDVARTGPRTLEQIGRIMGGISRERVRQIEQAALNALRQHGGDVLVEFLSERLVEQERAARESEPSRKKSKRQTG